MSSHKMSALGPAHRRVPDDIDRNPILLGHEFAGEIIRVGARWQHLYKPGMRFSVQPGRIYIQRIVILPRFPYNL